MFLARQKVREDATTQIGVKKSQKSSYRPEKPDRDAIFNLQNDFFAPIMFEFLLNEYYSI